MPGNTPPAVRKNFPEGVYALAVWFAVTLLVASEPAGVYILLNYPGEDLDNILRCVSPYPDGSYRL